jgi:hypothetical protein
MAAQNNLAIASREAQPNAMRWVERYPRVLQDIGHDEGRTVSLPITEQRRKKIRQCRPNK